MPNFKYTAYGKDGKEIKSTIEAANKDAASQQLRGQGL